ncbi:MAG TPA: o-succinylbenzoate--CoA ligase [Bacillota bacterium]|nr:o-succinylbenzoate--CoA ligase [Bacillota bacterium]
MRPSTAPTAPGAGEAWPPPSLAPDWLAYRAEATPGRLALVADGARLSFAELEARVQGVAAALRARGMAAGDLVAVLLPNGYDFAVAVHALMRLRGVLVPLNTRLAPPEVIWQLGDCRPRLLIHALPQVAAAVAAAHPDLDQWAVSGLAADPPAGRAEPADIDLEAVQAVVYTSGTTGRSKGAMLTYGNHWSSAVASSLNLGHHLDDRWLLVLPMFHVGGLAILMRGVINGTAVFIPRAFDAEAVSRSLDEDRITLVSLVGDMLRRVLAARGEHPFPAHLRVALLGGGPVPLPLLEASAARGLRVVQSYGLTETASQVVALAPEDARTHLGASGRPLPGNRIRIAADGEILVQGPSVMKGYLHHAGALADGWLHTGDIGEIDSDGMLRVLARRTDLIVRGGENVYPAEVESALAEHPAVIESGVSAVADSRWGQAPVAFVHARAPVAESELIAFCRERLAAYKVPVRIHFTGPLPRNAAGKLLRSALVEAGGA